jgi:hypothetical protein
VQLQAAIGFRGEHPEQAGIIHRLINATRQLPIGFGNRGMFGDQRADALDRAEQITEGLISHDKSLPCFIRRCGSQSRGASYSLLGFNVARSPRRSKAAAMILKRSNTTDRAGWL